MSFPRTRLAGVAALGLTVVLAACGGGGASSSTTRAAGSSTGNGTGSPLEQLFSDNTTTMRAFEDEVARCMRERGWQYTPHVPASMSAATPFAASDPAFVEKYGYGISTEPPPEAFGATLSNGSDDPNVAYQQSLSDADQARYQKDLYGAVPAMESGGDGATDTAPVIVEPDPNSCSSKAQAAMAQRFPEASEAFGKRFEELLKAMEDDPKVRAALTSWSACMAKAKRTYATPDDAYADFATRAQAFGIGAGPVGSDSSGPDSGGSGAGGGAAVVGVGAVVGAEGGSGAGTSTTLNAGDRERLVTLQAEERTTAKADMACREDTLDKVRPAVEQELVDKLRSEFPGIGGGK